MRYKVIGLQSANQSYHYGAWQAVTEPPTRPQLYPHSHDDHGQGARQRRLHRVEDVYDHTANGWPG